MTSSGRTCFPILVLLTAFLPISSGFTESVVLTKLGVAQRGCGAKRTNFQVVSAFSRWTKGAEIAMERDANTLKQLILDEASGTSNGLKATPQQRDAISKAVNALVALNPTKDITTSELATGSWDLVFTTTPGASGGKIGPFVGEVQQEVDIAAGLYVNYVRVGPLTGKLDATWEVVNKRQWKVTLDFGRDPSLLGIEATIWTYFGPACISFVVHSFRIVCQTGRLRRGPGMSSIIVQYCSRFVPRVYG
ncbi:unnamed protein product [Scytosiphon promiscuus]